MLAVSNKNLLCIDPRYFCSAELEILPGDSVRAQREFGGTPETTGRAMSTEMVVEDLKIVQRHALLKAHGLEVPVSVES